MTARSVPRLTGVRRRRAAIVLTFLLAMAALVAVPGRGYMRERADVALAESRLVQMEKDNDRLQRRRESLDEPAEIQRIARRDYGLVEEGEESYSILPPATAGLVLPDAWPFDRLADSLALAANGS